MPNSEQVLTSMPRRKPRNRSQDRDEPLEKSLDEDKLEPVTSLVICRFFLWILCVFWFLLLELFDRVSFRSSRQQQAIRIRKIFRRMGSPAVKIGQNLSARADIVPKYLCEELRHLANIKTAIPANQTVKLVESAIGQKLSTIFKTFDLNPIATTSSDCVYQGELHTGKKVAVKVLRPGFGTRVFSELKAILLLMTLAEEFGFIRAGLKRTATIELTRELIEELNFTHEARRIEIFRRDSRKCPYVSAPKVFHNLSNHNVLVTEFIEGAFLVDIITALEKDDREAINNFKFRGFDPAKLSRRIQRIFFWEIFESHFLHLDPNPANIIVTANNRIIFKDFELCIPISHIVRRNLLIFYQNLMIEENLSSVVNSMIALVEPLPQIDIDEYSRSLLNTVRDGYHAQKSRHSKWQDKSTGTIWLKMIDLSRQSHCMPGSDIVRFCRASFLYDDITYQLNPAVNVYKEFKKWHTGYAQKSRKKIQKQLKKRCWGPIDKDYLEIENNLRLGTQLKERIQHYLDLPTYSYASSVNKMSYVASTLTKGCLNLVGLMLISTITRLIYLVSRGQNIILDKQLAIENILWGINQPALQFLFFGYFLIIANKIVTRLDDVDVKKE